jgi:hypothetical protein
MTRSHRADGPMQRERIRGAQWASSTVGSTVTVVEWEASENLLFRELR